MDVNSSSNTGESMNSPTSPGWARRLRMTSSTTARPLQQARQRLDGDLPMVAADVHPIPHAARRVLVHLTDREDLVRSVVPLLVSVEHQRLFQPIAFGDDVTALQAQ